MTSNVLSWTCAALLFSTSCTEQPPPVAPSAPAAAQPADAPSAPPPRVATNAMPPVGKYRLVQDFSITGCVEHVGGSGIAGGVCKKEATELFAKDRVIDVETFFWDDVTREWGAKVTVFDQFRTIPVKNIERVP